MMMMMTMMMKRATKPSV